MKQLFEYSQKSLLQPRRAKEKYAYNIWCNAQDLNPPDSSAFTSTVPIYPAHSKTRPLHLSPTRQQQQHFHIPYSLMCYLHAPLITLFSTLWPLNHVPLTLPLSLHPSPNTALPLPSHHTLFSLPYSPSVSLTMPNSLCSAHLSFLTTAESSCCNHFTPLIMPLSPHLSLLSL